MTCKSDQDVLDNLSTTELEATTAAARHLVEQIQLHMDTARGNTIRIPLSKREFNQLKPRRIIFSNKPLRIIFLRLLEEQLGLTAENIRVKMYTRLEGAEINAPISVFDRAEMIVTFS